MEILFDYYLQKYKTDKLEIVKLTTRQAEVLLVGMGYHRVERVK